MKDISDFFGLGGETVSICFLHLQLQNICNCLNKKMTTEK